MYQSVIYYLPWTQLITLKTLGMFLNTKLDFQENLKNIFNKINNTVGLLRKFHYIWPRSPLLTAFKSIIRPHLDYEDITHDQAYSASFHQNLKYIQCNSALAITGAIRGASKEKLYIELSLETFEQRRWYGKLCCIL